MFVNACTLTRAHAPVRFQRGVARLHTLPASLDRGAAESHATFAIRAATASALPAHDPALPPHKLFRCGARAALTRAHRISDPQGAAVILFSASCARETSGQELLGTTKKLSKPRQPRQPLLPCSCRSAAGSTWRHSTLRMRMTNLQTHSTQWRRALTALRRFSSTTLPFHGCCSSKVRCSLMASVGTRRWQSSTRPWRAIHRRRRRTSSAPRC